MIYPRLIGKTLVLVAAMALNFSLVAVSSALQAASIYTSPYIITTLAGTPGSQGSTNGTGAAALFYGPSSTAVDAGGNVYVADAYNNMVRKITPDGGVTPLAGSTQRGSSDGTGSAAHFHSPGGVAVDSNGNVYVADTANDTIRKITPDGGVTTLAGTAGTRGSTDGTGSAASFSSPSSVAVDSGGNVYVADSTNDTIRKITPGGGVTTLAGTAGTPGSTDGTGSAASFNTPEAVAVDNSGNVYVADYGNDTIRKITANGGVTTLAGAAGTTGSTDGTGSAALFNNPEGVAVDAAGNVYVTDGNSTIRKITTDGGVTTLAGTTGTNGSTPGTGSVALFASPGGLAVDASGNIYIADFGNETIRKGTPTPIFTTFAGEAGYSGTNDGTGSLARFYFPLGVAVDGSGNVYVADDFGETIRKITPDGGVTTFAGTPGVGGSTDGTSSVAQFNAPFGVAVDGSGNVIVADSGNSTIRKITPNGTVSTLAGSPGHSGYQDGSGSAALFYQPTSVAVDQGGNIYVADQYNSVIRVITATGVETLAGMAGSFDSTDGTGSSARFAEPDGVAVDGSGNVYVADSLNETIRKITPDGGVTTLAGTAGSKGSSDGQGSAARFYFPNNLTLDGSGNLYVTDLYNDTIREITPSGLVTTLGGSAGVAGNNDGEGTAAKFSAPYGIAMDSGGNLYVSDENNDTIHKGTPAPAPSPALDAFGGIVTGGGLKRSPWFGHYTYSTYPFIYEYNLGYEYVFPTNGGVYLYDYTSGHFWYTQSNYFPFVYDFSLNTFLYYYQANTPHRHFYSYATNSVITE